MSEITTPENPLSKACLSWREFWFDLIGVTESTARKLYKSEDSPRFFLIGRQRFIKKDDALDWVEQMAVKHPYTPRRYKKGARHD